MNFSAYSIRNPVPAVLLFALLTLAGLLAFRGNVVQDFPDIELPFVVVNASLPGAAPAQLETEVARKIEDSVATLQGIKNIYTNVLDGEVTLTAEFILEKNISDAVNEVRDAVARVRADLPADLRDPAVTKAATAGRVVLTMVADSDSIDEQEVSWYVDHVVTKRLLTVPGWGPSNAEVASHAKSGWSWMQTAWRHSRCPPWIYRVNCVKFSKTQRVGEGT